MESSSRIVLHSLLEDLGEIRRLGIQGVVSGKPGKGAMQFISCSITEVSMLVPRSLWNLSTALVRSPVRVCSACSQGRSRCLGSGVPAGGC